MKINGIIWMIAGGILLGVSYYMSGAYDTVDIQKFTLFIWAGFAFVAYGLIKTIFWIMSRPKKAKIAKENYPHHQAKQPHKKEHIKHNQHNHQQGKTGEFVKFCSGCGNAVRHFDQFCYKCGSRLFHGK